MRGLMNQKSGGNANSFLPDDYIEKKHETRTNIICLTLFFIVIFGVVGAFFVTNRAWETVKDEQEAINLRYKQAAKDLEQLKELEGQRDRMLGRAALTASLIEKAPRTIVLAELINRMPENVALQQFDLEAQRLKPSKSSSSSSRSRSLTARVKQEAEEKEQEQAPPEPPRYRTSLSIVGVATTHNDVAAYVSALQSSELLQHVELRFSERVRENDRDVNKFRIECMLRADADARRIEPLTASRASQELWETRRTRGNAGGPLADVDEEK